MKITIHNDDGSVFGEATFTPNVPVKPKLYPMINCINWGGGMTTPLSKGSEFTYFVLLVNADGSLKNGNEAQERAFIAKVLAAGGIPTFSIAGGTQNIADITKAVTDRTGLVNAISARMAWGYRGVTLDIENTNLSSATVNSFITTLRNTLGADKVIGIYSQPYQTETVWKDIGLVKDKINWISPMLYDNGAYNKQAWIDATNAIANKVGKDKTLYGLALNYAGQGNVTLALLPEVMDTIVAQGWKGLGIWENTTYNANYQAIVNKYL